jgi:translation initiation factor 1
MRASEQPSRPGSHSRKPYLAYHLAIPRGSDAFFRVRASSRASALSGKTEGPEAPGQVRERLLSSTGQRRVCPDCGWPAQDCHCSHVLRAPDEPVPAKITANLRLENRSSDKSVTVVGGLPRNPSFLQTLAKELKKSCGTGGHAGESSVELQGDQRERLRDLLAKKGWTVKG